MKPIPNDIQIITKEDFLYRRFPIAEEPKYLSFWKMVDGKKVPSSAAFKTKPGEDGLSVELAKLTTPEKAKGNPSTFGIAEFSANIPLSAGYECVHDKKGSKAHALIIGDTNPIAKKLSRNLNAIY